MHTAIPFEAGELEPELQGEIWTVRIGEREARSKWLDFALSTLLEDSRQAHEVAVKLTERLLAESLAG